MSDPSKVIPTNKRKLRAGNEAMLFPSDIRSVPYHTKLSFVKYHRSLPNKPHTEGTSGTIILPLPSRLPENYHINYQGIPMSWRGMSNEDAAIVKSAFMAAGQDISNWYNNQALSNEWNYDNALAAGKSITDPNNKLLAWVLGVMPKNFFDKPIGRAAANYLGKVPNPHMTTVFDGVDLRQLTFEWQFSPRDEQESRALRDIQTAIKARSHPTYDHRVARFALNYPEQCYIEFVGAEDFLEPVHKCVIRDIVMESAPNDLAFYPGGAPVSVTLAITVQEVEIRTREDWDDNVAEDGSTGSINRSIKSGER